MNTNKNPSQPRIPLPTGDLPNLSEDARIEEIRLRLSQVKYPRLGYADNAVALTAFWRKSVEFLDWALDAYDGVTASLREQEKKYDELTAILIDVENKLAEKELRVAYLEKLVAEKQIPAQKTNILSQQTGLRSVPVIPTYEATPIEPIEDDNRFQVLPPPLPPLTGKVFLEQLTEMDTKNKMYRSNTNIQDDLDVVKQKLAAGK